MGNYSTSYYYVVNTVLTYIPSPIIGPTVVPAIRFRYNPPLLVKIDNKNKYFIKRVNNIKYNKWKYKYIYLIKWKGFTKPI